MSYKIEIIPRSQREELIEQRWENSEDHGETIYDFRDGTHTPKVIYLPINVPIYRMENCRAFSEQRTRISKSRGSLPEDFFLTGQETSPAQKIQHEILKDLTKRGGVSVTPIINVLSDVGQREALLITRTGVVVNGNRRLCAMRELRQEAGENRFAHVKCEVLPFDITLDEINGIEARLQARPATKLDYGWVGDAELIRRQYETQVRQISREEDDIKKVTKRAITTVAKELKRSPSDIENRMQALLEAEIYLKKRVGDPNNYSCVSGDAEQIFGDIPKGIAKKDEEQQRFGRLIAWTLFENKEKLQGRIYNYNPAFGDLALNVLDILRERLDINDDEDENDADADVDDFDIDLGEEEKYARYQSVARALENKDPGAVKILPDAALTAIEREKNKEDEEAAAKALKQIAVRLMAIDVSSAEKTPTLFKMQGHVASIQKIIEGIGEEIEYQIAQKKKTSP